MLSDYDPVRYEQVYCNTTIGEGLFLWHRKITERNNKAQREIDLHTRLALMQMDWTAKVMTGENTGLYEKYVGESRQVGTSHRMLNKKPRKKKKLTKAEIKKAIDNENQLIVNLKGFFRK